jgi:hypothetical protein
MVEMEENKKVEINLDSGAFISFDTRQIDEKLMAVYEHFDSNVKIFQNMVETKYLKREMHLPEYLALQNILIALHGHKYHEIITVLELLYMFINSKEEADKI